MNSIDLPGEYRCLQAPATSEAMAIDTALHRYRVWHILTQNPPVRSCRDAAYHRRRMGEVGIPLCDELKSLVCATDRSDQRFKFVVLHARGHQYFDLDKASALVGARVYKLSLKGMKDLLNLDYGTVNPLSFINRTDVRQIIDRSLLKPFFTPGTVMTNCGHVEYAVELRMADIIDHVDQVNVGDIVRDGDEREPKIRKIGFLTTRAPAAGTFLWRRITQLITSDPQTYLKNSNDMPEIIVRTIPSYAGSEAPQRQNDLRSSTIAGVKALLDDDADVIAVIMDSADLFGNEIGQACGQRNATYVSMMSETLSHLRAEGIVRADILSSDWSPASRSSHLSTPLEGVDLVSPTGWRREVVNKLIREAGVDIRSPRAANWMRDLLRHGLATDTLVVASPEVSHFLEHRGSRMLDGRRVVDSWGLVAERITQMYTQDRLRFTG